jgi:lantibiotic modifying enzyme
LIASGEYPMLIDLETLLHPRPHAAQRSPVAGVSAADDPALARSVLRTGMLPYAESFFGYRLPEDISGLGGNARHAGTLHSSEPGTNGAGLSESLAPVSGANLPTQDGRPLRPEDHENELIAGFAQMYFFLQTKRELLLARDGPLQWFADRQVRFLFRDTRTYALLFQRLWHPQYLRDGADWSVEMAALYRAAALPHKTHLRALIATETAALENLDVPVFTVSSSDDCLTLEDGQRVEGLFEAPSHDLVRCRIRSMCKEDLDRQIDCIRASLQESRLGQSGATQPAPAVAFRASPSGTTGAPNIPPGAYRDAWS